MSLIGPYKEAGIAIYTGLPGGGKSYQAAQLQIEWLESGNPVLSNLKVEALPFRWVKPRYGKFVLLEDADFLEFDQVLDENGHPIYEEYLDEKGRKVREPRLDLRLMKKLRRVLEEYPGKHPLVLIDEAPNYYASQDFKSNPRAMKAFLRQHRHLGCSVVAVAQNHGMLDNNFNRLCQEYRHHKNLVKDSQLNILLWWFGDNFHLAYSMANAGGRPFTREIYGRQWFRIKKRRAAVYSTVQMHATDLPGQVRKVRSKSLRLFFGFIFLGMVFTFGRFVFKIFSPSAPAIENKVAVESVEVVEPNDRVRLQAVELVGDKLVFTVLDQLGRERVLVRPGHDIEDFYKVSERIGQDIEFPAMPTRPMAAVLR